MNTLLTDTSMNMYLQRLASATTSAQVEQLFNELLRDKTLTHSQLSKVLNKLTHKAQALSAGVNGKRI